MPLRLSPDTEAIVNALFLPQDRDEAIRLLVNECGNDIPNVQNDDEFQLEYLRLDVLYRSKGGLKQLWDAIDIAKRDFRELSGAGNMRAFKREVLGDRKAAQRIRLIDHFFIALVLVSGIGALGIGATGVSLLWLTLPIVLIAIAIEALHRNSTDRPLLQIKTLKYGFLLLASRFLPGVMISGLGYLGGHFASALLEFL